LSNYSFIEMQTSTEENYLKAIYKLSELSRKSITTNAIADRMNTKAATVTDMVQKLHDKKLVRYERYKGVGITDKGKKVALAIIRKHRLWEVFLVNVLQFKWDEVHAIAEQMEHVHSDELTARLDKFLGYPKFDPHGDPIPNEQGKLDQVFFTSLSAEKENVNSKMAGVTEHSVAFLQHLEKLGLQLGCKIKIIEKFEYDQSCILLINDKKEVHVSYETTRNILIQSMKS
jgi:DtxR family transcriptional regulator, Mn-dependent transcriptional regulator